MTTFYTGAGRVGFDIVIKKEQPRVPQEFKRDSDRPSAVERRCTQVLGVELTVGVLWRVTECQERDPSLYQPMRDAREESGVLFPWHMKD